MQLSAPRELTELPGLSKWITARSKQSKRRSASPKGGYAVRRRPCMIENQRWNRRPRSKVEFEASKLFRHHPSSCRRFGMTHRSQTPVEESRFLQLSPHLASQPFRLGPPV